MPSPLSLVPPYAWLLIRINPRRAPGFGHSQVFAAISKQIQMYPGVHPTVSTSGVMSIFHGGLIDMAEMIAEQKGRFCSLSIDAKSRELSASSSHLVDHELD